MDQPQPLPDNNLATVLLPLLLLALGLLAILAFGTLILVQYQAEPWPYLLAGTLAGLAWLGAELLRRRRQRAAGLLVVYGLALLPILSAVAFGLVGNPLIALSALGIVTAGLLLGSHASLRVALVALFTLSLLLLVPGLIGQSRPSPAESLGLWAGGGLLIMGTAGLAWAAAHHVQGTIGWAHAAAIKAERRERLLREAQEELERTLRERDQLNEQLVRQSIELDAARTAAETAYRSKANFMATMSHELRTPLNIIIGFSTAMIEHPEVYDDYVLPSVVTTDLSEIRRSGQHLLGLIDDILDLARIDAGHLALKREVLSLNLLLDEVMGTTQGLLRDRPLQLRCEYPADLPQVMADPTRVRQVLLNLISNACKFTPMGEVAVGARADQGEVVVWVRDTGIGIAAADQNRIFDQFEQVENADQRHHTGTGLGLAICRWLIDLHGGRMWLESELGAGSVFYFTLPQVSNRNGVSDGTNLAR
jgi:signal transduction histidine kinase